MSAETASQKAAKPPGKIWRQLWTRWMLGPQLTGLDDWPPTDHAPPASAPIDRLNWSIRWHTLASRQAMRWYNSLKVAQISAAAAIPVITASGANSPASKWLIASLGALIVVLEGIQQLKKYGQNGLLWAQGKEALKREYYLYQANVPPYDQADPAKILARRTEQIIGTEVSNWADHDQGDSHRGNGRKSDQPDQR